MKYAVSYDGSAPQHIEAESPDEAKQILIDDARELDGLTLDPRNVEVEALE